MIRDGGDKGGCMTALKLASLNANVPSDSGVGLGTVGPPAAADA